MGTTKETRLIASDLELRKGDDQGNVLAGYAAVFDVLSDDLGGFVERIHPEAFTRSLSEHPDVAALYNHDSSAVLGRTPRTLSLRTDDTGLYFELSLPDTTHGRDVAELVKRGDLRGCSFGFSVNADKWDQRDDQPALRELLDVSLFEISLTVFPAYPDTTVALRSLASLQPTEPIETTEPEPKRDRKRWADFKIRIVEAT